MPNDQGGARTQIQSQITLRKSELDQVLQERREAETAIEDLDGKLRKLVARKSDIGSQEGTLRKEIGDLQSTLDAMGPSRKSAS